MKYLLKFSFALLCILCSLASCSDDDNNDDKTGGNNGNGNGNTIEKVPTLTSGTVSAKWDITEGNSVYSSFEFNESGNYIIVGQSLTKSTNDSIVYFGSYKISTDSTTMILTGFGTIKVSAIDDNNFSFSLILDSKPAETITLNAKRASEITRSTSTELLCRTWEVNKYFVDGIEAEGPNLTILFSKAGTYFVDWKNDPESGGLAKWRWVDSEEKAIQYTWDNEWWSDEGVVEINELTENSLKITEIEEEGTVLYELIPVDNTEASLVKRTFIPSVKSSKNKGNIFSGK